MARACSYQVTRLGESDPESWVGESPASQPRGRQFRGEPDPRLGDSAARKVAIDLTGDVTLEDPDDVPLGPSFFHSAVEVGGGLGVVGDPNHGDAPECAVGLTVTTVVPAQMPGVLARVGWDRGHTAEVGPGGLRMETFGVVAGRHQQRRGSVGPDPEAGQQIRSRGPEKGLDLLVQFGELSIESSGPDEPATTAMPWWPRSPDQAIGRNAASLPRPPAP